MDNQQLQIRLPLSKMSIKRITQTKWYRKSHLPGSQVAKAVYLLRQIMLFPNVKIDLECPIQDIKIKKVHLTVKPKQCRSQVAVIW